MRTIDRRVLDALFLPLFFAGLLLRIQFVSTPSLNERGPHFEYDPHFEYGQEIADYYGSRPSAGLSFSAFLRRTRDSNNLLHFHPPLYHAACALLSAFAPGSAVAIVKLFSLSCSLLTVGLLFLLLAHFFGNDRELVFLGLNLLIFLPGNILFSGLASNDALFAPLCALFVLLSSKWNVEDGRLRQAAALGLLCALLLLTKYTGWVCLVSLGAVYFLSFIQKKISARDLAKNALLVGAIAAVLAGWFYLDNFEIYGNPFYLPPVSPVQAHGFLSFHFLDLLASRGPDRWHESSSIATGLYDSFFSFDWVYEEMRELPLRNAVFLLSLLPLALAAVGAASCAVQRKFDRLNVFFAAAVLCVVKLLWKFDVYGGWLKSAYFMFLVPVCAVYFAEGCRVVRARNRAAFLVCLALLVATDAVVAVYFHRAIVRRPEAPAAASPAGLDPIGRADALLHQGRVEQARAEFLAAIAAYPDSPAGYNGLAICEALSGRPREAAAQFRRALKADPNYHPAYAGLAKTLEDSGDLGGATEAYADALRRDPKNPDDWDGLGRVATRLHGYSQAETAFRTALALAPGRFDTRNNLGISLMLQGRVAEAAAEFSRALELKPDYEPARRNLDSIPPDARKLQ